MGEVRQVGGHLVCLLCAAPAGTHEGRQLPKDRLFVEEVVTAGTGLGCKLALETLHDPPSCADVDLGHRARFPAADAVSEALSKVERGDRRGKCAAFGVLRPKLACSAG